MGLFDGLNGLYRFFWGMAHSYTAWILVTWSFTSIGKPFQWNWKIFRMIWYFNSVGSVRTSQRTKITEVFPSEPLAMERCYLYGERSLWQIQSIERLICCTKRNVISSEHNNIIQLIMACYGVINIKTDHIILSGSGYETTEMRISLSYGNVCWVWLFHVKLYSNRGIVLLNMLNKWDDFDEYCGILYLSQAQHLYSEHLSAKAFEPLRTWFDLNKLPSFSELM